MGNVEFLCEASDLDIRKTFECGQCFRWNAVGEGTYRGVALDRYAVLSVRDGRVYIESESGSLGFWSDYFDLGTDYAAARASIEKNDYLRDCALYGAGIRILRQDKWEALCSFIISQCNNIPRIKGIVERLCALFGERIDAPWETYSFPPAERIASLGEDELSPLRAGYRSAYILSAARAVASGEFDLEETALLTGDEAIARLKSLAGVGDKVASCAALFGLHRMDAFPIDTWIRKTLKANFPPDFDPKSLGEYAGLAQQYMFFAAREKGV